MKNINIFSQCKFKEITQIYKKNILVVLVILSKYVED